MELNRHWLVNIACYCKFGPVISLSWVRTVIGCGGKALLLLFCVATVLQLVGDGWGWPNKISVVADVFWIDLLESRFVGWIGGTRQGSHNNYGLIWSILHDKAPVGVRGGQCTIRNWTWLRKGCWTIELDTTNWVQCSGGVGVWLGGLGVACWDYAGV